MKKLFFLLVLVSLHLYTSIHPQILLDKSNQDTNILQSNYAKSETLYLSQNRPLEIGGSYGVTDSIISLVVSQINPDSIRYFIQKLQDFQTRFLFASNRFSVASWIRNEFLRLGLPNVELDSFYYEGTLQHNVVATLPGRINLNQFVLIGGHYDSFSEGDPLVFAPGADDNGSGTAAVFEIARVLKQIGYIPDKTIKFIAFAAEEYGMWGSKHFAEFAVNEAMDIKLMINNDMIAYTAHNLSESSVTVSYGYSSNIRELALHYLQYFSLLTPVLSSGTGPDDGPFNAVGYKTLSFMEDDFNPDYHTPEETLDKLNMDYCAEVIKVNSAVLLKIADMPDYVKDFMVEDVGNGNSVQLSWKENIESDVIGYNISVGSSEGIYDTTFFTTDSIFVVTGLLEGAKYYFGVSAVDVDSNESFKVEKSIAPNSFPLTPQNFADYPQWHKVMFSWSSNKELDLIGYNIYRSETDSSDFVKINQAVITDTSIMDENMILGKYYYYILKAVDSDLNESNSSSIVKSMAVSLDKGILLVDETKNGTGNLFEPTDEEVDQFYNNILSDFYYNNYDVDITGEVKLADLGAFSSIVWQGNDNSEFSSVLNAVNAIKEYLEFGGNLLYTGFSASKSFKGNIGILNSFTQGDFIYDYLKIDTSINKLSTLFLSTTPKISSYNFINVDTSKSSLATNYHIKKIEAISSNAEGIEIYRYNSNYDSTTSHGSMQGLPVGVEYIGNDYKSVILNIPLYYMYEDQARELINYVLQSKLNELTDVEESVEEVIPSNFVLYQNYPNPFNPSTTIKFALPVKTNVSLNVYNTLGEKVVEIFNGELEKGYHEIMFNASELSSGIYFYQIKTDGFVMSNKMILLK
jgi:hypothetical protein